MSDEDTYSIARFLNVLDEVAGGQKPFVTDVLLPSRNGTLLHIDAPNCWCCPLVERFITPDGLLYKRILHNKKENAN